MENQINVGDQNPVIQPVPIPEKPKINYMVIGLIILVCFVVFGFEGFYLRKQSLNLKQYTNNIKPSYTSEALLPPQTDKSKSGLLKYENKEPDFSFYYPENYPIIASSDINYSNPQTQDVTVWDYPLQKDFTQENPQLTQEYLADYYLKVDSGQNILTKDSVFTLWALNESVQNQKLKNGKNVRVSTTFSAIEVCDLQFSRRIEFAHNNHIIMIEVNGDRQKIRDSMPEYFKLWGSCSEKSFKENAANDFYRTLMNGKASAEATEWYNTSQTIIETFTF